MLNVRLAPMLGMTLKIEGFPKYIRDCLQRADGFNKISASTNILTNIEFSFIGAQISLPSEKPLDFSTMLNRLQSSTENKQSK